MRAANVVRDVVCSRLIDQDNKRGQGISACGVVGGAFSIVIVPNARGCRSVASGVALQRERGGCLAGDSVEQPVRKVRDTKIAGNQVCWVAGRDIGVLQWAP